MRVFNKKGKNDMNKIIKKILVLTVALAVFAGCFGANSVYAAKKKRHEYYWSKKVSVKVKGKKLIVKGKAYLTHKLDSGTDPKVKSLGYKKRVYKITKKTKFYTLHWSQATKISRKKGLRAIKGKEYGGFQVLIKGKKIIKLYMLNGLC